MHPACGSISISISISSGRNINISSSSRVRNICINSRGCRNLRRREQYL